MPLPWMAIGRPWQHEMNVYCYALDAWIEVNAWKRACAVTIRDNENMKKL